MQYFGTDIFPGEYAYDLLISSNIIPVGFCIYYSNIRIHAGI